MRINIKAGVLLALFAILAGVNVLTLGTQKALAATGVWVDAAHIQVGDVTFIDSELGDSMNYYANGNKSCSSEIRGFRGDYDMNRASQYGSATLVTRTRDPYDDKKCNETSEAITLANTANAAMWFKWIDSGRLLSVVDGNVYTFDESTNEYISSGSCKNSVTTNGEASATLTIRGGIGGDCEVLGRGNILIGDTQNFALEPGTGDAGPGTGEDSAEYEDSCETNGGKMSWIICPALEMIDNGIDTVDKAINGLLVVKFADLTEDGVFKQSWGRVRNVALTLLIPVILLMVIGTALGFSFVDAYTVKRAMPRLLVAVIFISLSWDICRIMIEATNGIGQGLAGLIGGVIRDGGISSLQLTDVFSPAEGAVGSYGSFFVVGGVIAGLAATSLLLPALGLLGLQMLAVLLSLVLAFMLLALRQMVIIALVLLSPLAIISWIFPGNDKLWKLWWGTFSKLLLLYPVIVVLIVTGKAFAWIIHENPASGTSVLGPIIDFTLKFVAYVGPYFFIPTAFKFAGGAFANIAGMANDRSRGFFDRNRKRRESIRGNMKKDALQRAENGKLFNKRPSNSKWNSRVRKAVLLPKAMDGSTSLRDIGAKLKGATSTSNSEQVEAIHKDAAVNTWSGNDDMSGPAVQVFTEDKLGFQYQLRRRYAKRRKDGVEGYANLSDEEINKKAEADATEVMTLQKNGKSAEALAKAYELTGLYDGDATRQKIAVNQVMSARSRYGDQSFNEFLAVAAMGGGTYFAGAGDTWRAAQLAADGDLNAEARLNVSGRKALMGAGRVESGGGAYGRTVTTMGEAGDARSIDQLVDITQGYSDHVYEESPGSTIAHASNKNAFFEENMIPAIQRRLRKAAASGDRREYMREKANFDKVYQNLAATKPALAKIVGEKILDMDIEETIMQDQTVVVGKEIRQVPTGLVDSRGNPLTAPQEVEITETQQLPIKVTRKVRDSIGASRSDEDFQLFQREWVTSLEAKEREAAARSGAESQQKPPDPGAGLQPPPISPKL